MSKIISATSLHKSYADLEVLKGVSLDINQGEIISIVGPSGAGKTTLLQILGTLDRPSPHFGTELKIDGIDVLKLKDKELARFRNQHIHPSHFLKL